MPPSNPRRVALSSSLALLIGAGLPVQQSVAESRPADGSMLRAAGGVPVAQASGFQMVPGSVQSDVLPARTPETPGANGFEMLPASAGSAATPSAAAADGVLPGAAASAADPASRPPAALALDTDASGFQLLAPSKAPATAARAETAPVILSAETPMQLRVPGDALTLATPTGLQLRTGGSAPMLVAEPLAEPQAAAPPRVVLYPDFRLDVRAEDPIFVQTLAHVALVSAAPAMTLASDATARTAAPVAIVAFAPTQNVRLKAGDAPVLDASALSLQAVDVRAEAPPVAVLASEPSDESAAGVQVLLAPRAALQVRGAPAMTFRDQGLRADLAAASAPGLWPAFATHAVAQARVLAAAPLETTVQSAPAVHRFDRIAAVGGAVPSLYAESVPSEPAAQVVRVARDARLALDVAPHPSLTSSARLTLVSFVPDAVVVATPAPEARQGRIAAAPSRRMILASDAPVATAPALELQPAVRDLSLAPATATEAASAQLQAQPVSAVAAPAPQSEARPAEPAILQLAQAAPGPASPAAPAQAPAPAAAPAPPPAPPPAPVVGRILVQGNERIEPSTILSYLPIQVGDTVDAAKIDLAVKTLFRTDLFADVALEMQGSDLIVKVSENPIINEVVFEGNHALKEDKLRDEVTVRPRGIFTRSKVEQDAQKIIELYRRSGRMSATVVPKIVQLPQKRVDLIFEIDEGPKSGILHINFVGNKSFSDSALQDVVVTRESHWYKFFQSNDNYDPDRIEYDREQLRKFYRNHGFYDFRIISAIAELAPNKNGFVLTFTVDEGPKYHFGKVRVTTELKRLNGELLAALLPIRPGQLYEDDRIEKATDALTYAAGANGFAFVDVRPRYVAHPETRTVDVTFDIKEGPRVYIERIDVVGNTQTLDYVIRREMRVGEGDAYNRVLVDRSKQQIKALGFFKDVDIEQLPGSAPDKTILRVKVTEQPTGQLTFSIGYSSIEKLVGDIGISQANFRGRGQKVDFEVSLGYLQKRVSLSFTEPKFEGRNMAVGFDIYGYNYNYTTTASFESSSAGVTLRTGFPINQYASILLRYSIHVDKVSIPSYVIDPTTGLCSEGYSQSLCDEVGTTFTSSVGYTVRLDRRNDPILPTRGFYIELGQDFAGFGGVRYIRTSANAAWYYGFTPKWILSFLARTGYITGWGGDIIRINDRFFEGGDTFRGFQIAGLGPRDNTLMDTNQCNSTTSQAQNSTIYGGCYGSALGAKAFAIGTVELQIPNPIPAQYGIKTAMFSDFGTVGLLDSQAKRNPDGSINPYIADNLAFRASAGVSIFWKSPMGPLRFDLSHVLKKEPYDVKESFYFSTTTQFQ